MTSGRLIRAVHSERQLKEMMTAFWFDHFNVFWGKGAARWMVSDYERTAIRSHVFGKFEDMVIATARHPAMLFYLDTFQSVVPDSSLQARERRDRVTRRLAGMNPRARDRARERMAQAREQQQRRPGLNENYARNSWNSTHWAWEALGNRIKSPFLLVASPHRTASLPG